MIYLDGIGLSFLINEIKKEILNYKLTKIYQYDRSSFSFYFGKKNLLFQVKDNSTIFYIKDELNEVKYGREFSLYEAR